jgi:hypothetical protein
MSRRRPIVSLVLGLLFGFFQGLRHAFEPDHVVAVSTLIGEQRGMRGRVAYAAAWGLGHGAMLVLVGAVLMLLRSELPARLDAGFELGVALMLVVLGMRAVGHAIGAARAQHGSRDRSRDGGGARVGWRAVGPLAMGMMHGLAGSGALTALVVAHLPSPAVGIAFMLLFGAGATIGMSLLAGAAGIPLAALLRTRWGMPLLLGATGALSLLLGLVWMGPAVSRLTRL